MGLSQKLYELFRLVNTVEEFPEWVALGVFDKGAPPPFGTAHQTDEEESDEETRTRRLSESSRDRLVRPYNAT